MNKDEAEKATEVENKNAAESGPEPKKEGEETEGGEEDSDEGEEESEGEEDSAEANPDGSGTGKAQAA